VPFQPWAKAFYEAPHRPAKNDPHARCVPPGGPRRSTRRLACSFGELPEPSACWSFPAAALARRVTTDGRPHPTSDDFIPTFLATRLESGRETLVVDSWVSMSNSGSLSWLPIYGIAAFDRAYLPDYNTLKYEATIDDPKAYRSRGPGGITGFRTKISRNTLSRQ
jgi:hypothetical protein